MKEKEGKEEQLERGKELTRLSMGAIFLSTVLPTTLQTTASNGDE